MFAIIQFKIIIFRPAFQNTIEVFVCMYKTVILLFA
jgi:hypothetical protein